MNRPPCAVLLCLATVIAGSVQADSSQSRPLTQYSQPLPLARANSAHASAWGLTEQEWSRFEAIQAGPRGFWSPHLDPLTALGVEAETELERQRYAELQVQLEAKRAERELAYQNAYSAAWARLFPGLLPIQGMAPAPASSPLAPRLALFVSARCPACTAEAQRLQRMGAAFDLYLVDSQGEDQRLHNWARRAGIEPARVQRRQITLNHDRGHWLSLGAQGPLPARYQQVNGQWQRLD